MLLSLKSLVLVVEKVEKKREREDVVVGGGGEVRAGFVPHNGDENDDCNTAVNGGAAGDGIWKMNGDGVNGGLSMVALAMEDVLVIVVRLVLECVSSNNGNGECSSCCYRCFCFLWW